MRLTHFGHSVNTHSVIGLDQASYPRLLKEIADAPEQLFVRGDPGVLQATLVAVVGTRKPTNDGIAFTRLLIEALNRVPDIVTVSGLAFGIDAAVAETAVRGGRQTVAVLASGIDVVTPSSHQTLARSIVESGGCLVSEYPPGTPADKFRFPARNRIIAGLSKAIVVVEAGEPSGALITAYQALDMNRDVFAVPGSPFNALAAGTNSLIKRGAIPLTHPDDLLKNLGLSQLSDFRSQTSDFVGDNDSRLILSALSEPRTVDQLSEACTIPVDRLAALLSVLELEGRIRTLPDQRVIATRS